MISHVKEEQFGEIPELDFYYCPYGDCQSKIVKRFNFMLHLATGHGELLPRLDRRLKELKLLIDSRQNQISQSITDELNRLVEVRSFLHTSPLFDVASIETPESLCNEIDVYQAYEKRHGLTAGQKLQVFLCYKQVIATSVFEG